MMMLREGGGCCSVYTTNMLSMCMNLHTKLDFAVPAKLSLGTVPQSYCNATNLVNFILS